MNLLLAIFAAGVLIGIALAVLADRTADFAFLVRVLARHLRQRRHR